MKRDARRRCCARHVRRGQRRIVDVAALGLVQRLDRFVDTHTQRRKRRGDRGAIEHVDTHADRAHRFGQLRCARLPGGQEEKHADGTQRCAPAVSIRGH